MKYENRTKSDAQTKNHADVPDRVRLDRFWKWFASNLNLISSLHDEGKTQEITSVFSPVFAKLHVNLGWEIGPGINREFALSITLNGSLGHLPVAESIMAAAPELPRWEINIGRPPKVWNGSFELSNPSGQHVSLDASSWRYVLTAFSNRSFYDISILAKLPPMDGVAKIQAATVAIQNMVGELIMLERFDRLEVVDAFDDETLKRSSLFLDLKRHIEYLSGVQP